MRVPRRVRWIVPPLAALALTCQPASAPADGQAWGWAFLGPVRDGRVSAQAGDGRVVEAEDPTGDDGRYALPAPAAGVVRLSLRGGAYREEADGRLSSCQSY